jgi:hypothetical protein
MKGAGMKWNWGWGVVALYGSFVVLIGALVAVSAMQDVDLVAPDYYARELRYEETIQKSKRAAKAPVDWKLSGRILTVVFPEPISSGTMHMYRPSDSRMDFHVPIQTGLGRTLAISLDGKPAGVWKMMADWSIGDKTFYEEKRFYVE